MEVKWKYENLFRGDAQKVYEEIGEDRVTPEQIVEKAKDESTELHKCFEWDNDIAAEKYRIVQAREILRSLVVTPVTDDDTPVRVYQISSTVSEYQPTKMFLEQPDEYTELLKRAKAELEAFKRRYHQLTELEEIFEAIDSL